MLTLVEKILFTFLALASLGSALYSADRIRRIIRRGRGDIGRDVPLERLYKRLWEAAFKFVTLSPTWRVRLWPSLFHALIAWGFTYYLVVNIGDGLEGFFPGFVFLGTGLVGALYRLLADILTVGVLVGMVVMLVRRLTRGPKIFGFRDNTLLHPKSVAGIKRASLIVGG